MNLPEVPMPETEALTLTAEQIDSFILDWSMRPQPETPVGDAWEAGARQGWEWAQRALSAGDELLRQCDDVLSEAALSEDFDASTALELVDALRKRTPLDGKTSAQYQLEKWWDTLCELVGIDPGDEQNPLPVIRDRLGKLQAELADERPAKLARSSRRRTR